MAFYLCCKITIGDTIIRSAHSVEITSTWKELSDKCTIELPTKGVIITENSKTAVRLDKIFKTGMKVMVELGYNGNYKTEFVGYLSEITLGVIIKLECEDETYNLKREKLQPVIYKKVTLNALLKSIYPEIKVSNSIPEVNIENLKVVNATKAFVLQELADKYGLAVYFRRGVLYAGLPYADRIANGTKYEIFKNVIDEDLKYLKSGDVRLKIRAVTKLPNNKKVEVEVGDPDGEQRTIKLNNAQSKEALTKLAEAELQRYKYEGYRGTITTFGIPYVQHGETVEINDPRYVERHGSYLVDEVKTKFGTSGFRREIEIAIKVSV